ncbi:hypothetical protein [Streptomyces sp. CA-111067]|uniref:hypothetical protein n=1 Tax=Streptomyces sp. CA-111067 TaxID=3240046 RepID=UPI003D96A6E7
MNNAMLSIAPRYLAASSVEDHHAHLVHLAKTAAWTLQATATVTAATSPCGLVTVLADRPDNPDAAHLFLSSRTHPARPARWKATLGGDLPVEFLAAMTTVLSAELLRDPDYVIYNLPRDGRLVALPGPGIAGWDYHADPNLVEWETRHRGTRAMALLRDRDSTAPLLAGGEDTLMMAAATLTAPGGTEVIWWAGFSHDIPAPVTAAFLTTLLDPDPVARPADSFLRPDLLPLLTTHRVTATSAGTHPPGPARRWGLNRGPGGR